MYIYNREWAPQSISNFVNIAPICCSCDLLLLLNR